MPRGKSSRRRRTVVQQLRHTTCSQFNQSGILTVAQYGLVTNRPVRLVSLVCEMASNVALTVQLKVHSPFDSELFVSPIFVVGTSTKRISYKLPYNEFGSYSSTSSNILSVGIGAKTQTFLLAFSTVLTVHYGDDKKSLC